MEELMMATIYVEIINAALALFLVYVYYQNYRVLKSNTGAGLLVFASVLLLENLAGLYLHFSTGEFYAKMVATHVFVLKSVELLALAALSYTAWKE
jgi:hypothetical protein